MEVNGLPIVKLGEILPASYKNGIYKSSESYGSGTPILRITDFDNDGNLVNGGLRRLELSPKEIKGYQLQRDDIVVNRVNSLTHLGKSVLWRNERKKEVVYESNMMRIEPNPSVILPEFLIRVLQSHNARSHFRKVAKRAVAQCSISQQDVKSLKFPLPPLPEQKKIAQILSTWDQAITATERLLENSQQRKKGLMQQLLTGKKRLPGFEGEWESVPLKEFLIPKKSKSGDGSHPVYSVTKRGLVSQEEYFKKSVAADDLSGYLIVDQADFVMSGLNFWMGSVDVHTKPFPVIVSPAYKVFSLSQKVDASYIRNFIQTSLFKRILEGSSVMGASIVRRNFNRELFMEWPIKLPSITEQEAISSVLDTENDLVHYLSSKLLSLKQEKKALMQQLLTGKRRVNVETEAA